MKKLLIAIFALNILFAQEVESIQTNRTLTIYKDSFAIIKEPILWNLKDGKNITFFNNLSPNIVFDSPLLNIQGVEVGSQTLNKNFYSTDSYLKKNIGSLVEVKPINDSVVQGALLDINSSSISISTNKGLMIFQRSRVEYILLKSKQVQNKFTPQISWEIFSEGLNSVTAELTYLSSGFSWKPVYKLQLSDSDSTAALSIDAEVVNGSNMNLLGVDIKVVEGLVPVGGSGKVRNMPMVASRGMTMSERTKELGDFYIFDLGTNLNLRALETIQFPLMPKTEIGYEKKYIFRNSERDQKDEPLSIEISFQNSKENNLELPLPSGVIYLYEKDMNGELSFIGKNSLSQLYKGGNAVLDAGKAFDIIGKRRILNFDRQNNSEESTISLQIMNTSNESIKVKAIEKIVGDWVIKESSSMYIKDDASTIYFPLEIQPNSSELITYTYRKEWK
ncbi:MAG: hypothetical protein ABGW72_01850 [bacterium]|jgi:hypothetical protein|nr:hypothetical protein [Candidatus Neomarinimicrobiota bacterium]HIL86124.1 hypothetical protein [Candidatus Neomarinimicrobiota bacterium]